MTSAPRLPSIRSRLTLLLVGVALVWGLLVSLGVWLAVRNEVDELLDDTLQASAEVLGKLLSVGDAQALVKAGAGAGAGATTGAGTGAEADAATAIAVPDTDGSHQHFAWQLVGPGGRLLLRSARAPQQPWLPLPTPGFVTAADGWRVYGLRLADGERVLYVAQTGDERLEAETEVVLTAVWLTLAVAALSAWWLGRRVRRELRPLLELPAALAHYEPLHSGAALPAPTRRELQPMQQAIEALGRRLAGRVANERAFSAHAAHALRTPLAGIDTQLAVAQREAPAALQPRLARVREAAARLTRVVTALLALFRSGAELQWQPLALPPLLQRLPHEGLQLRFEPPEPDMLQADADLLAAALINLLDNAVRHGAGEVVVSLQPAANGGCRLRLHDDGRGCTPQQREQFAQALAAQDYEGRMGLGLMLADLVARAHGGALGLPAVARGFAVELHLGPPPAPAGRAR
ncbi:MAG: HAMP domain-containing histidine kinase [Proteobacteria bacterium]|nr:HAMP domain-containing histidine kinase [Pseudomonadota bacterium]